MYLSDIEIQQLCIHFADPNDKSRICWCKFVDSVDEVFTKKKLEKNPFEIIISPPTQVAELPKEDNANWHEQKYEIRDLCSNTIHKIKNQISTRKLFLRPVFRIFDRKNMYHVTRAQLRQVLLTNGILISAEEFTAIEKRYQDDLGFNYKWFLDEADPQEYAVPKYEELHEKRVYVNTPKPCREATNSEKDILMVLGRIKAQVNITNIY